MPNEILKDRIEAGLLLAEKLKKYQNSNTIVLAIPRGGVPVGNVIAKILHLPLDIVLSKKIPHPFNKEFAIGAVSLDATLVEEQSGVPEDYINKEVVRIRKILQEKHELYMGHREPLEVTGKNLIIVDDGIATGNTLLASIAMLRKKNPLKIIVAVPVVPDEVVDIFKQSTDEFVYLMAPKYFRGVGAFYEEFTQVQDDEVIRLLGSVSAIG
jgi:putative phosphoribosyl transferase